MGLSMLKFTSSSEEINSTGDLSFVKKLLAGNSNLKMRFHSLHCILVVTTVAFWAYRLLNTWKAPFADIHSARRNEKNSDQAVEHGVQPYVSVPGSTQSKIQGV